MTDKFDEATIRVSASYGLKVPTAVDYSPEDAHVSFSMEVPAEDIDVTQAEDLAQRIRIKLMQGAKLAVLTELGVPFNENEAGTITPDLTKFKGATPTQTTTTTAPKKQSGGWNKGGGQQQQRGGGAKVDYNTLPKYNVTTPEGENVTLIDLRGPKADGTYSPKAADFKVDGQRVSFWLNGQDGTPNADVVAWLQSQGVEV